MKNLQRGKIVRYAEGSTALMRIEHVEYGRNITTVYGEHCMGGTTSHCAEVLVEPSSQDLVKWKDCRQYRQYSGLPGDINSIATVQWRWVQEVGWHNKSIMEYLNLIHDEVSEASQECRSGVPSDRFGEELADIILRTLDVAVEFNINIYDEIRRKIHKNYKRGTRGRKL